MEFYKNRMLKSNAISVYNGMIESLYYYSDHILMIDIQTDPIKHLPIKSLRSTKISVFNSKYRIGLEILAPANPRYVNAKIFQLQHLACTYLAFAASFSSYK